MIKIKGKKCGNLNKIRNNKLKQNKNTKMFKTRLCKTKRLKLGGKNTSLRQIFVTGIVNSPTSNSSQEKCFSRKQPDRWIDGSTHNRPAKKIEIFPSNFQLFPFENPAIKPALLYPDHAPRTYSAPVIRRRPPSGLVFLHDARTRPPRSCLPSSLC